MAINLMAIKPHKVSRDLSGYITYIYGAAKVGKTTLCSKFPKTLIIAFERGYNALPGVMVQDVTRWSEFKEVIRELKKPEVKETFQTIVIDTVDVAGSLCEKYICNQLGIDNIGDGGWTNNGWSKYKKELEDCFRTITQLGYALVCISHDKDKVFKRKDGSEYNQTVPTAQNSLNNIVRDMADLYLYAAIDEQTKQRKLIIRSLDGTVDCGSRFKYMVNEVPLDYDALINALNDAIDKEAKENDNKFVTEERTQPIVEEEPYDYYSLMNEFNELVQKLMSENQTNAMKITAIVDKYLGKGKKVSDSTPSQVDLIHLIVEEIKAELINH
jgi:hypothetical protein